MSFMTFRLLDCCPIIVNLDRIESITPGLAGHTRIHFSDGFILTVLDDFVAVKSALVGDENE